MSIARETPTAVAFVASAVAAVAGVGMLDVSTWDGQVLFGPHRHSGAVLVAAAMVAFCMLVLFTRRKAASLLLGPICAGVVIGTIGFCNLAGIDFDRDSETGFLVNVTYPFERTYWLAAGSGFFLALASGLRLFFSTAAPSGIGPRARSH